MDVMLDGGVCAVNTKVHHLATISSHCLTTGLTICVFFAMITGSKIPLTSERTWHLGSPHNRKQAKIWTVGSLDEHYLDIKPE